jgi:2,5-diketo-D-gluconate reductase B
MQSNTSSTTSTTGPLVTEAGDGEHPLVDQQPATPEGQPIVETTTGLTMPALGLGTWQLDDAEAREIVRAALGLGYRHIDTAQMYDNEAAVGAGIADSGVARSEIFLTTKVADDRHEPDELVRSVEASLARLGTDHVDLLLLHWPVRWERIGATLAAMANVQAAGLTHHLGVSNFTVEQLEQVREFAPLEVLQVECHPFFQQHELRRWCEEAGWAFTAYSPLARGDVLEAGALSDIGEAHGAEPTTVALAWLLQLTGVCAIPRTADADHLSANWSARDLELTADDMERIATLDDGRRLVDPDRAPW